MSEDLKADQRELDTLRSIVVGPELTRVQDLIHTVSAQLEKRIQSISKDIQTSIEMLDNTLRADLRRLEERIEAEESGRSSSFSSLRSEVDDLRAATDGATRTLHSGLSALSNEVHESIQEHLGAIKRVTQEEAQRTNLKIEKTREDVLSDKIDRSTVACVLSEVAQRLGPGYKD